MVSVPDAVRMADLSRTGAAAGPIIAGVIGGVGKGTAIGLRAGKNVVLNWREVALAADHLSILGTCGLLKQIAAALRLYQRVSMEFGEVLRNDGVLRLPQLCKRPVEPRAGADTVAGVHRRLAGASLGTEICAPGVTTRANFFGQRLTMCVGVGKAAEISTIAQAYAGHEESHAAGQRLRAAGRWRDALSIRCALLSLHQARRQH